MKTNLNDVFFQDSIRTIDHCLDREFQFDQDANRMLTVTID